MPTPCTAPARTRIVGGMFGLELDRGAASPDSAPPAFLRAPHLRLATARGGLAALFRALRPRTAWLPSFLCPIVLPAFADRVRFFSIDASLQPEHGRWVAEVQDGDLVVFIDYFGFRTWESLGPAVAARGACIVEDASQALLAPEFSSHADYVVTSPRKFLGMPDGCTLLAQHGRPLPDLPLAAPGRAWWSDAFRASVLRRDFDRSGGDRRWFELFRASEAAGPVEPARMSDVANAVLDTFGEWDRVTARRRANFELLAAALPGIALFPKLEPHVVPLGFPVVLADRDRFRLELFAREIFPPVHWPIEGVVPASFAASHSLAAVIMTLPCDQRYEPEDLLPMIDILRPARRPAFVQGQGGGA